MNIDERLERLTRTVELLAQSTNQRAERQDALTQTVELLAHSVTQQEKLLTKHDAVLSQHEKLMTEIMEGAARLLHVAQAHEQRLERLERGLQE